MGTLICKACAVPKPPEDFYLLRKGGHRRQRECIQCALGRAALHREDCRKRGVLNASQRTQQRLKLEVLRAYGGDRPACACCNETHFEFLSIDHTEGGGNTHRRQIKAQGTSFYLWLRANNFPPGFRVLCHNCNQAIGHYGYCPHSHSVPLTVLAALRETPSEIRRKISEALPLVDRKTVSAIAEKANLFPETVQSYRAEFVASGAWTDPGRRRRTCGRGHVLTPETTVQRPDGSRYCKACDSLRRAAKPKTGADKKKADAQRSYWSKLTPEQRAAEVRSRLKKGAHEAGCPQISIRVEEQPG